jgi:hypothetical protein
MNSHDLGLLRCCLCAALTLPVAARAEPQADQFADIETIAAAVEVERARIPERPKSLRVEALRERVVLAFDHKVPHADRWNGLVTLCPVASQEANRVTLICRTGRIEASLVTRQGLSYLDVRELRGVPVSAADSVLPLFHYDPSTMGLGGPCPGTTPAGLGECFLAQGDVQAAREVFEHLEGRPDKEFAALRLGDLALADGDVSAALRSYRDVPPSGPIGRAATARVCEITGNCLGRADEDVVFESVGLPEPLATEMELRRVRMLANTGRLRAAAMALSARLQLADRPPVCESAADFCAALVLAVLDRSPRADTDLAMHLFLALPDRTKGPYGADLAEAAARASEILAAPEFGANLLALAVSSVPPGRLDGYLREAMRLFVVGGDVARADAIFDFARERLGDAVVARREWKTLEQLKQIVAKGTSAPAFEPAALSDYSKDLTHATEVLLAARRHSAGTATASGTKTETASHQ